MSRTMKDLCCNLYDVQDKPKKVDNNTIRYTKTNGDIVVRLHHTDIATLKPSGDLVLSSGGWHSVTTKDRLNNLAKYLPIPSRNMVTQRAFVWRICGIEFYDGITLHFDAELGCFKVVSQKQERAA